MCDLAWLAGGHAARGDIIREYDAEIPDEPGDGATDARLYRDGESVLEWSISKAVVRAPEAMAGRHLFRGFTTWALLHLDSDDLEAALVFQKAYFVAQARRYAIMPGPISAVEKAANTGLRSEEHTSELQSLMRISYAVFCLKKTSI